MLSENITFLLQAEHLSNAALADILDAEGPELINCLPPPIPRSLDRMHVIDPFSTGEGEGIRSRRGVGIARLDRWGEGCWCDHWRDAQMGRRAPLQCFVPIDPIRTHRNPLCG